MAMFMADQLASSDRLVLLDALERSAAQSGLAIAILAVSTSPPEPLYLSAGVETLFGRTIEQLRAGAVAGLFKPEEALRIAAVIASRTAESPPITLELEALRADGQPFVLEAAVARIPSPLGDLAVCHLRDVSDRHETLEALRRSMERFRNLVERAPDGVVIVRAGRIVFANEKASLLLGVPTSASAVGLMLGSLLPPADAARAGERMQALMRDRGEGQPSEYGILSDPSRTVEIKAIFWEWEGAPAVLAFARDVSERAGLRRELARADRLAALGTLAAAVAHEINNPLTYASLSIDLIEQRLTTGASPESLRAHVVNARAGLERVATIVRDLSAYAREQVLESGPVDLPGVIERALRFVEHDLRHRARVVRKDAPVAAVDGDAGRLEQVLVNLLVNAAQAVGDGGREPVITIETGTADDGTIVVAVEDSGPGVPRENRERIFDPFFTTKKVGQGTGLGLSVCKSLVEAMGGRIVVSGEPSAGARFTVHLKPHQGGRPAPVPAVVPAPEGPKLSILIVDDEPLIRRVVGMMLSETHDVVEAADAEAALAALAARPFDAIVCDMMMPGRTGMELHADVARLYPGLDRRMIFVTGGAFLPQISAFLESVDNPKVSKPFDEQVLLSAIRRAAAR